MIRQLSFAFTFLCATAKVALADFAITDHEMTIGLVLTGCRDCYVVQIEGKLPPSTAATFERFVARLEQAISQGEAGARLPPSKEAFKQLTIFLDSPGGNFLAGWELGRAIRKYGFSTGVGRWVRSPEDVAASSEAGRCASACAYAFLGGIGRTAYAGEIGVHQFYDPEASPSSTKPVYSAKVMAEQQEIIAQALEYVNEMGVSSEFLRTAGSTPSDAVHYFSEDELTKFHVTLDPDLVTSWRLATQQGGLMLVGDSGNSSHSVHFYCRLGSQKLIMSAFYNHIGGDKIELFARYLRF